MPVDMGELMDYLSRPDTHKKPVLEQAEMREAWAEYGEGEDACFEEFAENYSSEDMYQWEGDEEYRDFINDYYFLPVNMYCHGGCTISTSSGYPFNDQWDSGIAGFVYIKKTVVTEEGLWGGKIDNSRKKAGEKFLESQVELLDDWMTGRVFWWSVTADGETLDSCYGYYGYDGAKYAMEEAKVSAEYYYTEEQDKLKAICGKRQRKIKNMIKNNAPLIIRKIIMLNYDRSIAEYTKRGVELAV